MRLSRDWFWKNSVKNDCRMNETFISQSGELYGKMHSHQGKLYMDI